MEVTYLIRQKRIVLMVREKSAANGIHVITKQLRQPVVNHSLTDVARIRRTETFTATTSP